MKALLTALLFSALTMSYGHADQNSPKLVPLFSTLKNPDTTPGQARVVTNEIWQQWLLSDNEAARDLMSQGIRMMNSFALDQAVDTFTRLIELEPEFAEAWNKRATVYYLMGRFDESTADVAETLRLEPRHFGALSGQGLIYLQKERKQAAVDWFKRALEVNPFMDNIRISVEELEEELQGKLI